MTTECILAFLIGAVCGIICLLWHQRSVQQATRAAERKADIEKNRLSRECDRLREDLDAMQRCMDSRDSYRQGKQDGERQQQCKDNVTRLSESLERGGRGTIYVPGGKEAIR